MRRARWSARSTCAAWWTTRRSCAPASSTSIDGWSRASSRRRADIPRIDDGTAVAAGGARAGLRRAYPRRATRRTIREAAAARLDEHAATAGPRVRLARLRGRRRRQRGRRHRPARAHGAARHAYRLESPASRHRRRRAVAGLRRAPRCRFTGRAPSARRRATRARRSRSGTPLAPTISSASARRPARSPGPGTCSRRTSSSPSRPADGSGISLSPPVDSSAGEPCYGGWTSSARQRYQLATLRYGRQVAAMRSICAGLGKRRRP